jgi:hypothetical protein
METHFASSAITRQDNELCTMFVLLRGFCFRSAEAAKGDLYTIVELNS